jgi:hypothetical protein
MKIWVNRNVCDSNLAACEGCFGQLVITGVPDRLCVVKHQEDGSETLTVYMHSEEHNEVLVIPPERREEVAYEGWTQFVSFEPEFRKNEGTTQVKK